MDGVMVMGDSFSPKSHVFLLTHGIFSFIGISLIWLEHIERVTLALS
jgi:hypothetical protein